MKKTLLMCMSVALVAVMLITGTLAYFQDSEGKVNIMTTGNVKITQNEQQRVEGNGEFTDELEEFEQEKILMPVTYPGDRTADTVTIGEYEITLSDDEANYVDKIISVTNDGSEAAYVRTLVAVPTGGAEWEKTPVAAKDCWLHWNLPTEYGTYWTLNSNNVPFIELDGKGYYVWEFIHKKAVESGKTTYPMVRGFYMDKRVGNDDNGYFITYENGTTKRIEDVALGDTVEILALSQAVQAEGFESAAEALNAEFGETTAENSVEWFYSFLHDTVEVEGNDKAALVTAIEDAEAGDTVVLTEDTSIAGYEAAKKLVIDKGIVLDLNGKTLTTESGWGGIDAKGGCSIKNGTINHTGNTAAIRAFQVESIENVTINLTQTAGKVKGGIVVQEGAGCYVGSIKNVTITGATNGIETYRCGSRSDLAIGSMENVTIDATDTGLLLSAPIGTATNCNIKGDKIGVNMYLYGAYSVSLDLVNSTVTGVTGIYAHDEVSKTNPGSLTLTYDDATVINGGITQEFEDEVKDRVKIN